MYYVRVRPCGLFICLLYLTFGGTIKGAEPKPFDATPFPGYQLFIGFYNRAAERFTNSASAEPFSRPAASRARSAT